MGQVYLDFTQADGPYAGFDLFFGGARDPIEVVDNKLSTIVDEQEYDGGKNHAATLTAMSAAFEIMWDYDARSCSDDGWVQAWVVNPATAAGYGLGIFDVFDDATCTYHMRRLGVGGTTTNISGANGIPAVGRCRMTSTPTKYMEAMYWDTTTHRWEIVDFIDQSAQSINPGTLVYTLFKGNSDPVRHNTMDNLIVRDFYPMTVRDELDTASMIGASYTAVGTMPVLSGTEAVASVDAVSYGAIRTGETFIDDQYATIDAGVGAAASAYSGAMVRWSGDDGYCLRTRRDGSGVTYELCRVDNGAFTVLDSTAGTGGVHTLTLTAFGDDLYGFVDGVQTLEATDATYSSGDPGFMLRRDGASATATADRFFAGDFYDDPSNPLVPSSGTVYDETVDVEITATTTVVDAVVVSETVDTTIAATVDVDDARLFAETADTAITATTTLVDAQALTEVADTTITATTGLADVRVLAEVVDTTATATVDAIDARVLTEISDTTIAASTGVADRRVFDETVDTSITADVSVVDDVAASETVDTTITSTVSALTTSTGIEFADTTITSSTSVLEVSGSGELADTTIVATADAVDTVAGAETADTTITATTEVVDDRSVTEVADTGVAATVELTDVQIAVDVADTSIVATTEVEDLPSGSEAVDTVIASTVTVVDVATFTEVADTVIVSSTEVADSVSGAGEILDVVITTTTEVTDRRASSEFVDVLVVSSTEVADVVSFVEDVAVTIAALTGVDAVLVASDILDTLIVATVEVSAGATDYAGGVTVEILAAGVSSSLLGPRVTRRLLSAAVVAEV